MKSNPYADPRSVFAPGAPCLALALVLAASVRSGRRPLRSFGHRRSPGTPRPSRTSRDGRSRCPDSRQRILIDDGRYLVALSLIHPEPAVGAGRLAEGHQPHRRPHLRSVSSRSFPTLDRVPQVSSSAGTFSLEKALAVKPDVAVFTLGLGPIRRTRSRSSSRPASRSSSSISSRSPSRTSSRASGFSASSPAASRRQRRSSTFRARAHERDRVDGRQDRRTEAAEGLPRSARRHVRRLLQLARQGQRRRLHRVRRRSQHRRRRAARDRSGG